MKSSKQGKEKGWLYFPWHSVIWFGFMAGASFGCAYLAALLLKGNLEAAVRSPLWPILVLIALTIGFFVYLRLIRLSISVLISRIIGFLLGRYPESERR